MDLETFLGRLEGVRRSGLGFSARCPAHDDGHASLSVSPGDSVAVVLHCHAGCPAEAVMSALGLSMSELAGPEWLVARYPYVDAAGQVLYVQQRFSPKRFQAEGRLPPPAQRVPYNLPGVLYAIANGLPVYVVEGEKDVETLRQRQVIATTAYGGAGGWTDHLARWLRGAHVVLVADRDDTGRRGAHATFLLVQPYAESLSLVQPSYGKDVTELLEAGYGLDHVEPVPEPGELPTVRADTVRRRSVQWAWIQHVPFGAVTIIDGDPGSGKSTLSIDFVARWTTGEAMPDGSAHGGPYHVVMVSVEDDPDTTIVPRLLEAGAKLSRIHLVAEGETANSGWDLAGHNVDALEAIIRREDAKILVLDPLMAFLPRETNAYSDADIRRALRPLGAMARRLGIAIVVIRHLTKSNTSAMAAGAGSMGIIGVARAGFLLYPDPNNKGQWILACTKMNLAIKPPSLAMEILPNGEWSKIKWLGRVNAPAEDLYSGNLSGHRVAETVAEIVRAEIGFSDLGWMTFAELSAVVLAAGHTTNALRDALGLVCGPAQRNPIPGKTDPKGWYYSLLTQNDTVGGGTTEGDTSHRVPMLGVMGENGRTEDHPEIPNMGTESEDNPTSDEAREAELEAGPHTCQVCGSDHAVLWAKPWWTWRCVDHRPLDTP